VEGFRSSVWTSDSRFLVAHSPAVTFLDGHFINLGDDNNWLGFHKVTSIHGPVCLNITAIEIQIPTR